MYKHLQVHGPAALRRAKVEVACYTARLHAVPSVTDRAPPAHVRRARLAKRVQLLLAIAAAAYAIYRLVALFTQPGAFLH